ncbi:MAG: hypothetical protein OER80_11410 [Gammaproteobacteria bacterium]|nr:hypothetical protein [Gammaproteobacteria bacterium]
MAGVLDDVGFTRLKSELGERLPTGKGISVAQVESSMTVDHDGDNATAAIPTWMPDSGHRGLQSTVVIDASGAPDGVYSGHATAVARRIIGRDLGMVTELDHLATFAVTNWIGWGFLRTGNRVAPDPQRFRVVNHSWASDSRHTQVLRRSDWLTDRAELIQVVGVRNAAGKENSAFMAALVNAVVVGRSDGQHSTGTPAIDKIYMRGRTRPHLVAPLKTGSAAAPTVTSAVILLLSAAGDQALSTRPDRAGNRIDLRIYDAGRSEVIRAVLMASADRKTDNSAHGNIESYRGSAEHRSDNGLDHRYGAGQLNVHNAWHILNAGEQEKFLRRCGFDYEPGLAAEASKRYSLPEVKSPSVLTATLSWNLLFPSGSSTRFDVSAVLNDLDLSLYEVTDAGQKLLQASTSRMDTTETIHATIMPGKRYRMTVSRLDDGSATQDFAVAWQLADGQL